MTDYEIMSLYTEYAQLFVTMVTVYISLLFAYLVATYVVASRLTATQFWLVTVLFVWVSFDVVIGVRMHGLRAASLQTEIVRRIEAPGSEIAFADPVGIPAWLPDVVSVVYVVAVVAAVLFALGARKKGAS